MAENLKADSSHTKTIEKSPLVLYDLPIHVLGIVAGKLPLVDCLALRKVSRDLRELVDSSQAHCKVIELWFENCRGNTTLDDLELRYEKTVDGGCEITLNRKDTQTTKKYRDDRNWKQAMFDDIATFLGNPKLEVDQIGLDVHAKATRLELIQFLKSLNLRLNVRSIRSKNLKLLRSIQEFLNPDKLEDILCDANYCVNRLIGIAETNSEILKNPKLMFKETLFIDYREESSVKSSEILKSINIRRICVADGRWIPTILQSSNPEKVENVEIEHDVRMTVDQFNEISGKKQWKARTRLWCNVPEWVGLEDLADFKEIRSENIDFTEENLIINRDILLKSPHLNWFQLESNPNEYDEDEMYERINRIMSQDSAYDVGTRRMSIPDSPDYFQLELKDKWYSIALYIRRVSPK